MRNRLIISLTLAALVIVTSRAVQVKPEEKSRYILANNAAVDSETKEFSANLGDSTRSITICINIAPKGSFDVSHQVFVQESIDGKSYMRATVSGLQIAYAEAGDGCYAVPAAPFIQVTVRSQNVGAEGHGVRAMIDAYVTRS
jgi:hypothetical protein